MAQQESQAIANHVANHTFTRGLPRAPRNQNEEYNLPLVPGDPFMDSARENILSKGALVDAETSGFENVSFLRKVTNDQLKPAESNVKPPQWKFEDRRMAQEILPFLYLGPAIAAKDEQFLTQHGITMVLFIRDLGVEVSRLMSPRTAQEMGLETKIVEFKQSKIVSALPEAIEAINSHLNARWQEQERSNEEKLNNRQAPDKSLPGKVLVYDLTGNDASAAVVVAYIMAMFSTLAGEAVFVVQGKRFSISSQVIQEIMVHYHAIIQAKRDTLAAKQTSTNQLSSSVKGRKRELSVGEPLDDLGNFSISGQDEAFVREVNSSQGNGRQATAPFSDDYQDSHGAMDVS